jgi:GDPmannose 4,6-dehydratase
MPRALITGITGQDGSYLSEQLTAAGYDVHGLVRTPDPEAEHVASRVPSVTLHNGDLADVAGLARLVDELAPDEIYNLAGISSVAYSWQHPVNTAQLTGVAVGALLQAAFALQERIGTPVRFVQASSSEIFGNPAQSPQDESTLIAPLSPYGAAKAYAHTMTGIYRQRGLHASTVILYNHESARRPEAFVTRKITAGAARIARGLEQSLSLGDLTVHRDWGWAPDYTRAMILAAAAETPDDYVIATGEAHTVAEFVEAAFAAAGIPDWEARVQIDPRFIRPNEINDMLGDSSKARTVLGWTPTKSFSEIVSEMVEADFAALDAAS